MQLLLKYICITFFLHQRLVSLLLLFVVLLLRLNAGNMAVKATSYYPKHFNVPFYTTMSVFLETDKYYLNISLRHMFAHYKWK